MNKLWSANKPVWRNSKSGDFSDTDKGDGWKKLAQPRVALYRSYNAAMDEGWTRWLLEKFGFAYKNVSNADIQKGGLKQSFDVIVIPDQAGRHYYARLRRRRHAGRIHGRCGRQRHCGAEAIYERRRHCRLLEPLHWLLHGEFGRVGGECARKPRGCGGRR